MYVCYGFYLPECCNLSEGIQQSYWQSLLIACGRYIQWYVSYLIAVTNDWVWRCLYITQRRITVDRTPSGRVISSSQRPLPDNTQHSQQTNVHAAGGIRTHNTSRRAAAELRLRPVFLNHRAAARYRALESIIPGRERFSWNWLTNLNVILYLSTCHTVHIIVLILFMIMP